MFDPIQAFALDDITTVYYNAAFQALYLRNDTDYTLDGTPPDWYDELCQFVPVKSAAEHEAYYMIYKSAIRKAAEYGMVETG